MPPVVFLLVFVGIPVILAIGFALGMTGGLNSAAARIGQDVFTADRGITLQAFDKMFADHRFWRDVRATVIVTLISVGVTLAIAITVGVIVRLRGGILAKILSGLGIVPLFIPVVIAAWSIFSFYGANGFLQTVWAWFGAGDAAHPQGPSWAFSTTGIVLASVWVNMPFCLLMTASGMQAVPDALIEAARDVGAGTMRIVVTVLIPLAKIPLIIAGTFTAIGVLGQFTIPYFVGPTAPAMLGVAINKYFSAFNQPQQAAVLALTIFVLALGVAAIYVWANFRSAKGEGRA
jgi:ABC-type spermidine/putrescine transport system permease subunit I